MKIIKLTDEQKKFKKEELNRKRREKCAEMKRLGLCRTCRDVVAENSVVFCEKHLQQHLKLCAKATNKNPVPKYRQIKYRAKMLGIEFQLDQIEFKKWIEESEKICCYCGVVEDILKFNLDVKKRNLTVDRKDNKIGYLIDNICMACFRCNNSKSDFFSHEEWMNIAKNMICPRLEQYHKIAYSRICKVSLD